MAWDSEVERRMRQPFPHSVGTGTRRLGANTSASTRTAFKLCTLQLNRIMTYKC